jgi:hypothetical protein
VEQRRVSRMGITTIAAVALLAAGALPAVAAGPEQESFEVTFEAENPCTGEPSTITLAGIDRFHTRQTPGGWHFVGHVDATWHTDDADPFVGRYHDTFTLHLRDDGRLVQHASVHFVGRNEAGQVALSRFVLQVRATADGVEREFVRASSTCVGRR